MEDSAPGRGQTHPPGRLFSAVDAGDPGVQTDRMPAPQLSGSQTEVGATRKGPTATPGADEAAVAGPGTVGALLAEGGVRVLYQPVVDLGTGRSVAYEALARGPVGHRLESPQALFAAARTEGLLTELDAACFTAATTGASTAGLITPWTLFVNLEPESLSDEVLPLTTVSTAGLRVVVELTERALTEHPAALLRTVARVRALGWGVALDDVGVNPDSLALVPLLRPDMLKLDATLIQQPQNTHTARVFSAVSAEAERTGCTVLAEGIETPQHLAAAKTLGARLGQGWLFGRPAPLPAPLGPPPAAAVPIDPTALRQPDQTPFQIAAEFRPVQLADRHLLTAVCLHLERQAATVGESCIVLATFQRATAFTPVASRYTKLAAANAYIGAFAVGLATEPAPGVRGVNLGPDEPLAREWDLVILGPHYAALIAARCTDNNTGDISDEHEYVLSHDRRLAVTTARALMARITHRTPRPDNVAHPN